MWNHTEGDIEELGFGDDRAFSWAYIPGVCDCTDKHPFLEIELLFLIRLASSHIIDQLDVDLGVSFLQVDHPTYIF